MSAEIKIKDFITGKVTYDNDGQYLWINEPGGGVQMLAELRGWGHIQNMFSKNGNIDEKSAAQFQDKVGQFIADAINHSMEFENRPDNYNPTQNEHN